MSSKADKKADNMLIDDAESIQLDKIRNLENRVGSNEDQIEISQNYLSDLNKEIEGYKEGEMTNQIKERIGEREKIIAKTEKDIAMMKADIEKYKEDIDELKSMTAEEYRDFKQEQEKEVAGMASDYGWRTILWFLVMIAASFVPGYTINKRESKRTSSGNQFLAMVFMIMGSGQTIRYRRADGTTYDDNSGHLGAFAAGIALMVASIIVIVIMLPYVAAFMVVRNIVLPYLS